MYFSHSADVSSVFNTIPKPTGAVVPSWYIPQQRKWKLLFVRDWLRMQQPGLYGDGNFNILPIVVNQFYTVHTSRAMCFTCYPPSSSGISKHTSIMYNTGLRGNKVPTYDGLISQESIRSQVEAPHVPTRYLHKAE